MRGMNPRLLGVVAVLFLLLDPVSASIPSVRWLGPSTFLSDSVRRHVVSSTEDYVLQWTVKSRDTAGRPLRARVEQTPEDTVSTADFSYSWDFDVGLPTVEGTSRCPSRLVVAYGSVNGPVRSDTSWFTWNAADRSLIRRDSWGYRNCPWSDSMVLDRESRLVAKVSCRLVLVDGRDSVLGWTRMRRGYANSDNPLPRWVTSATFLDSVPQEKDSVAVQGDGAAPTHARLFSWDYFPPPRDTTAFLGWDSLRWDSSGRILSSTRWYDPGDGRTPTRFESTEYTWVDSRLEVMIQSSWDGDTETRRRTSTYLYSWDATSTPHRTPRPAPLRRTADGRVSLAFASSAPARVEWITPDGRRTVLHDGPVPRSPLELATPRGLGFLRVRQEGQVRVHSLPSWSPSR